MELLRPAIAGAIARVARAERLAHAGLTPRECQVLDLVAAGHSNQLIARRLGVRLRTVDKHLEHVYAKLGVCSRTAAVARLRGIAH
jgi:DNA-binding CsgD family transcriptional regulator